MNPRKTLLFSISLFLLVLGWTACGGDSRKTPVVSTISITANALTPAAGTTVQLTATGKYSDGSSANLNGVTWTSSNDAVATVSSTGLVTTRTQGTVTITCRYENTSATVTINVAPAAVASLALSSSTVSIPQGRTHTFVVTGTMTDGTAATNLNLTWTSSDSAVATISNAVVTTHKPGTATITVASGNVSASAIVTVLPAAITAIAVTPANSAIMVGLQQQFTATATYTDSTTRDVTATANWSSSAPAFAALDTSVAGLVHAVASGTSTITATLDSLSGSTTVTVNAEPTSAAMFLYTLAWSAVDHTYYLKTLNVEADGAMHEVASVAAMPDSGKFASDGKKFIYVDANEGGTIQIFRIDRSTGSLAKTADFKPATGKLYYITLDPTAKWLFGFDTTTSSAITLRVFAIDNTSGALTDTGFSYPVGEFFLRPSGQAVTSFVTNASGTYFYWGGGSASCTGYGGSAPCRSLFGYQVDMATGALTPLTSNPFGTWSPQVSATAISPDGAALWLSLDAYRIVTYSLDSLTGVPTETDRWWPSGSGSPIQHLALVGNYIFGGQSTNLLRITPPADHRLSGGTVSSISLPNQIWDVAFSESNSMLFASYTGGIASFTLDSNGLPVPASTTAIPMPQQLLAVDKIVPAQ
jgi:uncharacterized protein YjdB